MKVHEEREEGNVSLILTDTNELNENEVQSINVSLSNNLYEEIYQAYIQKKKSIPIGSLQRNLRFLIAEDIPYNQDILKEMLNLLEFKDIIIANNGIEAIEKLKDADILLLDLKMPYLNGFQVLEYLKSKRIPIKTIITTASVHDEEECQKYNIFGFIPKPINLNTLRDVISKVFDSS